MNNQQQNKFNNVKLNSLIKYVQSETLAIRQAKKEKKSMTTKIMKSRRSDLSLARESVIERLNDLDRTKPSFFPIGAQVDYVDSLPNGEDHVLICEVVGHDAGFVHINPGDQEVTIKTLPEKIRLINIRYENL